MKTLQFDKIIPESEFKVSDLRTDTLESVLNNKKTLIKWPRREGATLTIMAIITTLLRSEKNYNIVYITPTERFAIEVFDQVCEWVNLQVKISESLYMIINENKNTFKCYSSDFHNISEADLVVTDNIDIGVLDDNQKELSSNITLKNIEKFYILQMEKTEGAIIIHY